MDGQIKQSTAYRVTGKCYLTADHITDATGLDPAIQISKNGGAFANPNAGASVMTEIGHGWYYFALAAEDTNTLGPLIIRATHATMDPMEVVYQIIEAKSAATIAAGDIASDAITAAAVKADAVTKIQSGLMTAAGYTTPPTTAQIRTELATELGRIDAAISSRLALSGYTAPDNVTIAAISAAIEAIIERLPEGSALLASGTVADLILALVQADVAVDTTTTPWQEKHTDKDSGDLLLVKDLKTTTGADVTSTDAIVGQKTAPEEEPVG